MAVSLDVKVFYEGSGILPGSKHYYRVFVVVLANNTGSSAVTNATLKVTYSGTNISGSNTKTVSIPANSSGIVVYNSAKQSGYASSAFGGTLKVSAELSGSASASKSQSYSFTNFGNLDSKLPAFDVITVDPGSLYYSYDWELGSQIQISIGPNNGFLHDVYLSSSNNDFEPIYVLQNIGYGSWNHTLSLSTYGDYFGAAETSLEVTLNRITHTSSNISNVLETITQRRYLTLPSSVRPTITTVTPSDTKGYRTTFGVYVQGKSILAATTTAQGIYNSTITKVDYEIDDKTASTTDLSLVKTIGLMEQSGSRTLKTTVTDSRGRTAVRNTAITVVPYVNPTMNLQALRWDSTENNESDDSDTVRLICSGSIPNVNDNLVTGTIIVQGRQKGVSEWTSLGTAEVSGTFEEIFTVSNQSVDSIWEYQATLTDYFGVSVLSESSVGLATPILEFHSSGKGVGLGIVAPEEGFDIGMDINVKGVQENGYSRVQITDPDGINSNILANLGGDTLRLLTQVSGVDRAFVGSHIFMDNNMAIGGVTTSGGQTPILRLNASNQVELTWTSGGLRGRVMKKLWSGNLSPSGSVTVSELAYYNVFAFYCGDGRLGLGAREPGTTNYISASAVLIDNNNFYAVTAYITASGTFTLRGSKVVNLINGDHVNSTLRSIYGVL